jgi:hypothetical protein
MFAVHRNWCDGCSGTYRTLLFIVPTETLADHYTELAELELVGHFDFGETLTVDPTLDIGSGEQEYISYYWEKVEVRNV